MAAAGNSAGGSASGADDSARPSHSILTIPSSDAAFAAHVAALGRRHPNATPAEFESHLRTLFPRVVVRERSLSGEAPAWYVYRDGSWRPQTSGPWWLEPGIPLVVVSSEGWIGHINRTAGDLLGISESDDPPHHFTDFIVPGALENAQQLFEVVRGGTELEATILLRPMSSEVIAVDLHADGRGDQVEARFRLALDVDIPATAQGMLERPILTFLPATDVAFRAFVERALARMAEPTTDGLELRVRRLYPHVTVVADGAHWTVRRDRDDVTTSARWWLEPGVARVRYDALAMILEANQAAATLFGRELVGHHWQEFVTPGSADEVGIMLEILATTGAVETRFRLPMPDGSLCEFDAYTEMSDGDFVSWYRQVPGDRPPP